jgi:hypothetical protein
MKKFVFNSCWMILLSILFTLSSNAQSLGKTLSDISGKVTEIQVDKITYKQSFDVLDEAKGKVRFVSVEVNEKGSTAKSEYEFFIGDIDKNTIIRKTSGKKLFVSISVNNKQKFIKASKDDKLDAYLSDIEILVSDADAAQSIMDNIKLAIPLVKGNEKKWTSAKEALAWLKDNIKEVAAKEGNVTQSFDFGSVKDYLVSLNIKTSDSKGAVINENYDLNILDINKNKVLVQVSGATLSVNIETKSSDKFIKYTKNNQLQNNTNELDILAEDIEQARGIISALTAAIEKSKSQMPEFTSIQQATEFVQTKTADVTFDAKTLKQNIVLTPGSGTKTNLKIEEFDSKGKSITYNYDFYLADIEPGSVNFKIGGKKVLLIFNTTNKIKLIKYSKDGVLQNFINDIELTYNDIESVREIISALGKAIKESNTQTMKWSSVAEAMKYLEDNIKGGTVLNDKYALTFEGDNTDPFQCNYKENYTDAKGAITETGYLFYPNTLDPASVRIESSGKFLSVVSVAKGKKSYVKKLAKENKNSYDSRLEIMAFDSKEAKDIADAMKYILTNAIPKEKVWADKQAAVNYIKENVGNLAGTGKEVKQKLDIVDNDPCKLSFTITTTDDKGKTIEEIYEFNLSDMNKLAVDFKTSSGNVYITLICKNKQKLVKVYKNGAQQSYGSDVEIVDDDIDTGKNIVEAFKLAISKCEQ